MLPLLAFLLIGLSSHADAPVSPGEASDIRPLAGMAEVDPTVLADAVAKLNAIGVVQDPQYWMENAQKGKVVPSTSMQEVLILAAGKFGPATTIEEALEILQKQKILSDMERWKHQLIDKSNFPGADAFFLLKVLAEKVN